VPTARPRYACRESKDTTSKVSAESLVRSSVLPEPVGPVTTMRSGTGSPTPLRLHLHPLLYSAPHPHPRKRHLLPPQDTFELDHLHHTHSH